jgi:hypothetical protein
LDYDAATLERTAKTFRSDMWGTVCEDAVEECDIAEACFGPVQATVFGALPDAPEMNVILGAAEPGAVEEGHLANAIAWADEFEVGYRVAVARGRPGTATAEEFLNKQGFEQGRGVWKYVRDTSLPDLPGNPAITVWEIGEQESDGETMVFSAAPALGLPGPASSLLFALPIQDRWRTYTAELEGRIVSFGSLLIDGEIARVSPTRPCPRPGGAAATRSCCASGSSPRSKPAATRSSPNWTKTRLRGPPPRVATCSVPASFPPTAACTGSALGSLFRFRWPSAIT